MTKDNYYANQFAITARNKARRAARVNRRRDVSARRKLLARLPTINAHHHEHQTDRHP